MLSNLKNPARELPPLDFPKTFPTTDNVVEKWRNLPYQERISLIRRVTKIRAVQMGVPHTPA